MTIEKKLLELTKENVNDLFTINTNNTNNLDTEELKSEITAEINIELINAEDRNKQLFSNVKSEMQIQNKKTDSVQSMCKTIVSKMTQRDKDVDLKIKKINNSLSNLGEREIKEAVKQELMDDIQQTINDIKNSVNMSTEECRMNIDLLKEEFEEHISILKTDFSNLKKAHVKLSDICMNQITPTLQKINM